MKAGLVIISVALLGMASVPAQACDFHGAGFGSPFGTQWEPFKSDRFGDFTDQAETTTVVKNKKARPVFSRAANKASDIAKLRLKKKADAKAKVDETETTQLAEAKSE